MLDRLAEPLTLQFVRGMSDRELSNAVIVFYQLADGVITKRIEPVQPDQLDILQANGTLLLDEIKRRQLK